MPTVRRSGEPWRRRSLACMPSPTSSGPCLVCPAGTRFGRSRGGCGRGHALFDFAATARGAEWIDRIAPAAHAETVLREGLR